VQFIQLVARGSITAAKLKLHGDKALRLEEAAKNLNYEHFADNEKAWRWTTEMLGYVTDLDAAGNYKVTTGYVAELREYSAKRARGEEAEDIRRRLPVLPARVALPPFAA